MDELIRKKDALDALTTYIYNIYKVMEGKTLPAEDCGDAAESVLDELPTLEIIRCKDCEHWKLQIGNVKGDGLGSCDFHNVNLVTGEGFCYWAEKRGEADAEITRCSDDTISRQAVIDLLKQMRKDGDMVPWEGKNVFARIRKLPSAQPKRKTGYKINQHQYPAKWVCSECGAKHFDFSDNFCSQCGADVNYPENPDS